MRSSIIIPTAGRVAEIRAAIESLLLLQPARQHFEILVIDNNTCEDISRALGHYCASLHGQVRYFRELSPGSSAARHRGAKEASGEILTFIDDDVEVSIGWMEAIHRGFEDPSVAMVGGPSIPRFIGPVPAWFWGFLTAAPDGGWMCSWLSLLDLGRNVKGIDPKFIWSLNSSIRRSVFESCGGFHPDYVPAHLQRWQGDGESGLASKVRDSGFRADYLQEALLFHRCGPDRLDLRYFEKRARFQGICDSFAAIRGGMAPAPGSTPHSQRPLKGKLRSLAGSMVRQFWRPGSAWAAESTGVKEAAHIAYVAGWRFHQTEVAADPQLLAWVRRVDYLDPDVWKIMV